MQIDKRLLKAQLAPAFIMLIITTAVTRSLIAGLFAAVIVFLFSVGASSIVGKTYTKKQKAKYGFISDESIFNNSILVLLAAVMRADKENSPSEKQYIAKALGEHFAQVRVDKMLNFADRLYAAERLNYYKVCNMVDMNFRYNEKIQLLHFLTGIVTSNGVLTDAEKAILLDIAINIDLPSQIVSTILNMFNYITEDELNNRKKRSHQKQFKSTLGLSKAFKILGLPENASVKAIKKAYRKMAMKHHPDRLIHLGEAHQKSAKEKFQIISDAYELIKSRKKFS